MNRSDYRHFYQMPIRWGDQDALGHVNNVQFARYLECGRVAYCDEVLKLAFMSPIKAGWILADLKCTFHNQLRHPGQVNIATRIDNLGNKSAQVTAAVFREEDDNAVLSSQGVFVWFDYENQKSVRIPDWVRKKINSYEVVNSDE